MANGAYWIGQDGNVWLKSAAGVKNGGPASLYDSMGKWDQVNMNYDRIADPNPPQQSQPQQTSISAPVGGGSGASSSKPLNQGAIDATLASLRGLDTVRQNALSSADTGYSNAIDALNQQESGQRKSYDENTVSNMGNYDSNLAASLRAGRSGLSGLMAALRGGGGGGNQFARDWVQNTVADTASNDIRQGYETFDDNRRGLDSTLSTFLTDLQGKRRQNEDALVNNKRAADLYDAQQRQGLFQTLAGLYGDAGQTGQADTYMSQAGAQAPRVASNMGAQVSRYDSAPVDVKSPDITAFSAPEQQSMGASPDKSSGIFSMLDPRRRKEETPAGV